MKSSLSLSSSSQANAPDVTLAQVSVCPSPPAPAPPHPKTESYHCVQLEGLSKLLGCLHLFDYPKHSAYFRTLNKHWQIDERWALLLRKWEQNYGSATNGGWTLARSAFLGLSFLSCITGMRIQVLQDVDKTTQNSGGLTNSGQAQSLTTTFPRPPPSLLVSIQHR